MADTITHSWQTVEQAAVTLNCSTRTIARRIAGGSIESRVDDNGRRLVLVETFGPGGNGERLTADGSAAVDANEGTEADGVLLSLAGGASIAKPMTGDSGYNPAATSVLAVLQSTIDAARTDAARARTGAMWAWAGVAVLGVAIGVSALLLTGRLTRAETKVDMLQTDVASAKTELDRSHSDLLIVSSAKAVADQRREAAEQAAAAAEHVAAAAEQKRQTAETELASVRQQGVTKMSVVNMAAAPPTTQTATQSTPAPAMPGTLFGRFVNLPIEPEPR